jgi:uncharacterized protein YciI
MFLVELTYIQPLSMVDALVPEHIDFLNRFYASGHFLLSGRKEPRTGGLILCKAESLAEVNAILAQDPFAREKLAQYTVTEFLPSKAAPILQSLL